MATQIFTNLIGATEIVRPECNRTDITELTTSESGLFLDKLEGLDLNTDAPCSIYDKMKTAISEAGKHLYADLLSGLGDMNSKHAVMSSYSGLLGETQARNRLYNVTTAVSNIKTKNIPGGRIIIKRIGLVLPLSTIVDIRLYKSDVLLNTWTVTTTANMASYLILDTPYTIDTDGETYQFQYTVPEGSDIFSNRLNCGCGSAWQVISKYISNSYSDSANGIILDATFNCNPFQMVEANFSDRESVFNVLSFALRFKAGEILCENIVASGEISRFTMLERNHLWGKRDHFAAEYNNRIAWLIESGFDRTLSGCYICNNATVSRYTTIRL